MNINLPTGAGAFVPEIKIIYQKLRDGI